MIEKHLIKTDDLLSVSPLTPESLLKRNSTTHPYYFQNSPNRTMVQVDKNKFTKGNVQTRNRSI